MCLHDCSTLEYIYIYVCAIHTYPDAGVGPHEEEPRGKRPAAHAVVAGAIRPTNHHRDLGDLLHRASCVCVYIGGIQQEEMALKKGIRKTHTRTGRDT